MSKVSFHICATPWNFINSFVFASNRPEETGYLIYVDYPEHEDNIYLHALESMGEASPFKEAWCFHGKYKGAWQKWRKRLKEIEQIKQLIVELKPDQVYVGSDRRIEFQCAMTEAVKHKPNVKGIYIDEGLFSYTCRKRSKTWRDRALDTWIKRFMYPCDWKHPITIGGSDWISEGWLLQPSKACKILAKKIILKKIVLDWYQSHKLLRLTEFLTSKEEFNIINNCFDALIILPHPSSLTEIVKESINFLIMNNNFKVVAVKQHPREELSLDWLEVSHFFRLPTSLPLELILPNMSFQSVIAGSSTATLTAKLMKNPKIILINDEDSELSSLILDMETITKNKKA